MIPVLEYSSSSEEHAQLSTTLFAAWCVLSVDLYYVSAPKTQTIPHLFPTPRPSTPTALLFAEQDKQLAHDATLTLQPEGVAKALSQCLLPSPSLRPGLTHGQGLFRCSLLDLGSPTLLRGFFSTLFQLRIYDLQELEKPRQ